VRNRLELASGRLWLLSKARGLAKGIGLLLWLLITIGICPVTEKRHGRVGEGGKLGLFGRPRPGADLN